LVLDTKIPDNRLHPYEPGGNVHHIRKKIAPYPVKINTSLIRGDRLLLQDQDYGYFGLEFRNPKKGEGSFHCGDVHDDTALML
jgi:hypothetical protein